MAADNKLELVVEGEVNKARREAGDRAAVHAHRRQDRRRYQGALRVGV
jgi:hypothetical protein